MLGLTPPRPSICTIILYGKDLFQPLLGGGETLRNMVALYPCHGETARGEECPEKNSESFPASFRVNRQHGSDIPLGLGGSSLSALGCGEPCWDRTSPLGRSSVALSPGGSSPRSFPLGGRAFSSQCLLSFLCYNLNTLPRPSPQEGGRKKEASVREGGERCRGGARPPALPFS